MLKRLFFSVLLLLGCMNFSLAQDEINFIYINGSNTNDEKSKEWFYDGVAKFHPVLANKLSKDDFVRKKMLNEGKYKISTEPGYLFWGDLSKHEIDILNEDINILKRTSPKVAQFVRRFIAMCFHDAIWISKFPNMMPVLEMLHKEVLEAHKNGDKVVLMGYSAGTFVTYQYFLTKLPVIDIEKIEYELNVSGQGEKFANSAQYKNTCMDALFRSDILTYNMTGGLVANPNSEILLKQLSQIDDYTKTYCAPPDTIVGVVNYATPIALFYSDLTDEKYKISQIRTLSYKYLIENNIFYMNVNYADDPLGIPVAKNLTISDTKEIIQSQIKPGGGFYYDKSNIASPRPFFAAHTSYWATAKKFSSAIVKAYNEGYNFFYETSGASNANGAEDL